MDHNTCKRYDTKPSSDILKSDVERWASGFVVYHISENHVTFGYKQIRSIPQSKTLLLDKIKSVRKSIERHKHTLNYLRKKEIILNHLQDYLFPAHYK